MTRRRFLFLFCLSVFLLSFVPSAAAVNPLGDRQSDAAERAQQMLSQMTPEERVGQLFLVSFVGANAGEKSQIYDLIARYHIGGVVLRAENDNFVAAPDTASSVYQLISQLQYAEQQSAENPPAESGEPAPNYIPLFIGISQHGDGFPEDQILSGLTPLPSPMAIGATWNPSLAEQVGSVAGWELSSLGFNLYFGPSLDVLESPAATLGNGLGVGVFGGDPYWVGALGGAYIAGLHKGSAGRLMVIADHFPGRGSSDRPPGGEPATVRKSLEALKQIELAPFFAVTGNAATAESMADGLLVSHIRYQGLQGNIRATTRPVSFDSQALSLILSLPPLSAWRTAGGLMVSDDLGSQTVRLSYESAGQPFLARFVARDAFLAGNDLLYMGNIKSSDVADNYTTIVRAVEFFAQKYNEDPVFARRVDDSVTRILTAKYRLYGEFDPAKIVPPAEDLTLLNQSQSVTFEVARQAATLVSPDLTDLGTVLPSPPAQRDWMVFLTDTRLVQQCSACPAEAALAVDALQSAVLRLYGPQAGGQVMSSHLSSYSLDSLVGVLEGGTGTDEMEASLRRARWIIINMLSAEPTQTQTTVLRRFLSERQDLLRDKNVIVFSFHAPYYLDSTDISKLTAYYCLYSKSAPFVEVAARLLFRELAPTGALPVSVSGVGYDLFVATTPDPNQVIGLFVDLPPASTPQPSDTPAPTSAPSFRVGDMVSVRTSVIVDHNGHPVPDGTGVSFTLTLGGEGGVIQRIETTTIGGVGTISVPLDRPGLLEIRASSDLALASVVLQLNVSSEGLAVASVTPTVAPTETPTPEPPVTPTVVVVEEHHTPMEEGRPGFGGWFVMVILTGALGFLAYNLGDHYVSVRWAVRWALSTVTGGLLAFSYLAVQLPGAADFLQKTGWLGMIAAVLLGVAGGAAAAYLWLRLEKKTPRRSRTP